MIIDLHRGAGFTVRTDDITSEVGVGGLTRFAVNDAVSVNREIVDGDIFPALTTLLSHGEGFEFETLNVDKLADLIGVGGQCLLGDTADYFRFFASKIKPCSPGLPSGSDNIRYQLTGPASAAVFGLMTPASITAATGQNARMSGMVTPKTNSGNAAIAIANNVAVPAAVLDSRTRFVLAESFEFGGVEIKGKTNLSINFGISMLIERADEDLAPSWVSVATGVPVIRVTGPSLHWALDAAIPRAGKIGTHANSIFFLKKRDDTAASGYYADTAEEHIKITVAGKSYITQLASASGNGRAETVLEIYPERDSSGNVPIIIETDQAIEVA
jgi:hypothetical protein